VVSAYGGVSVISEDNIIKICIGFEIIKSSVRGSFFLYNLDLFLDLELELVSEALLLCESKRVGLGKVRLEDLVQLARASLVRFEHLALIGGELLADALLLQFCLLLTLEAGLLNRLGLLAGELSVRVDPLERLLISKRVFLLNSVEMAEFFGWVDLVLDLVRVDDACEVRIAEQRSGELEAVLLQGAVAVVPEYAVECGKGRACPYDESTELASGRQLQKI